MAKNLKSQVMADPREVRKHKRSKFRPEPKLTADPTKRNHRTYVAERMASMEDKDLLRIIAAGTCRHAAAARAEMQNRGAACVHAVDKLDADFRNDHPASFPYPFAYRLGVITNVRKGMFCLNPAKEK